MKPETVYIGCGAGFSGDRFDAAVPVVETLARRDGPRYLIFETLAERTLALEQKDKRQDPSLAGRSLEAVDDPAAVEAAVTWRPPHGLFRTYPNLALIQSMAAGVDHVLADPHRPAGVPVARVVDPWMARSMVHQVALAVLRWHRRQDWVWGSNDARTTARCRCSRCWPTTVRSFPSARSSCGA